MDFKQQSSFIPKQSLVEPRSTPHHLNGLLLIAIIIFLISSLGTIGLYGYNYLLNKEIASIDAKLLEEKKNFQPALLAELARTDKRIETSKDILSAHVSASSIFDFLSTLTVRSVQFKEFLFGGSNGTSMELTLKGVGRTFNSVALQSDVFRKQKYFKNPIFSNLQLDEFSNVLFDVKVDIDPALILYVNSLVAEPIPTPISTPQSATSTQGAGSPKPLTSPR